MNKRGQERQIAGVIIWLVIILLIFAMIFFHLYAAQTGFLEYLPETITSTINTLGLIFIPIIKGIYLLVAPPDQPENVQMIAFAIFLLLTLVGNSSLRPFIKGPFLALMISAIVGLIAARSLTSTILQETALGASPIAAVSLLLGFIPIFALTKNIDKWGLTQLSKMIILTIVAVVYIFVFWVAFDAQILGLIYGVGIICLGAGQLILPYFSKEMRERNYENLGEYMASVQQTVANIESMREGAWRVHRGRRF